MPWGIKPVARASTGARQINGNCMQIVLRERVSDTHTFTLTLTQASARCEVNQNQDGDEIIVGINLFFFHFKLLYVCVELPTSARVLTERRCTGW